MITFVWEAISMDHGSTALSSTTRQRSSININMMKLCQFQQPKYDLQSPGRLILYIHRNKQDIQETD